MCIRVQYFVDDQVDRAAFRINPTWSLGREERTDSFDGPSRADIVGADHEDHTVGERERVLEHEPFHLTVVTSAPIVARQERPPDFDRAVLAVVPDETRRSDQAPRLSFDRDQRPSRVNCLTEERAKHVLPVAIAIGMLRPYLRVDCDLKQRHPVVLPERTELDQVATQVRLKIGIHVDAHCIACRLRRHLALGVGATTSVFSVVYGMLNPVEVLRRNQ